MESIKKGKHSPGDRIPSERELAEMLGVGRSSVREAVQSLVEMGVLEKRMGIGMFVQETNMDDVVHTHVAAALLDVKVSNELLDLRMILEVEMAARAAEHATQEHIHQMEQAMDIHVDSIQEGSTSLYADTLFHRAILAATNNSVLTKVYLSIEDLLTFLRQELLAREDQPKTLRYHSRIFEAIKAHDADAARQEMHDHLQDIIDSYQALVDTRHRMLMTISEEGGGR